MTDPTNTLPALSTLAARDQHAGPCAHCNARPAVVLEYLCAECDALESAPSTVAWEPPAAPAVVCRGCGEAPPAVEGLCPSCWTDLAVCFDEARWTGGER